MQQSIQDVASDVVELESSKQDTLISGQNIKTINSIPTNKIRPFDIIVKILGVP